MGQGTEELTTDIDRTRQELSRDVDALYDKVSPARVVERRKAAVRDRFSSVKSSVMGSAQSAGGSAQGAAQSVTGTASGAVHSVQSGAGSAVHAVERKTEGSPLGAGLVAFGAGMIISALIPASQKEAEIAGRITDAAKDSPVADQAKAIGQEMGQNLKESAAGAVDEVKASAQDAAQHVKEEGQSAAQSVKDDAPGT